MIAARTKLDTQYGLKGYEISKFNGQLYNKWRKETTNSDWNKEKGSFIDREVKQKSFVPEPTKYQKNEMPENKHIYKKVSTPALYMTQRKTEISEFIKKAEQRTIGPGSFNPKSLSAKRVTGVYGGQPRITFAEVVT